MKMEAEHGTEETTNKRDDLPQILCDNLSVGYDGETVAQGISFTVCAGDYLCIVGENGSGKSTLMKTLLKLTPPIAGKITYSDDLRTGIGYLPQQTQIQRDFPASVQEIVISGCQARKGLRPFYNAEEKALAKAQMERMGIGHLAKHCYRELSGGQQQRVLLARALCAANKILLLDEPVTGLDPVVTAELYALIRSLHREGVTILMISHDIDAALQDATKILHIGNKIFFGSREEYLQSSIGESFSGFRMAQGG